MANKGLAYNFQANYTALISKRADLEGHFGNWCTYNENVFCQERDGCGNCLVKKRITP